MIASRVPAGFRPNDPAPPSQEELERQFKELFEDINFQKLIGQVASDVARAWNVARQTAGLLVISALGEPATLPSVHAAWRAAKTSAASAALAKVIVRRRVIDLMRRESRRPQYESLPRTADEIDGALRERDCQNDRFPRDPRTEIELHEIVEGVRTALDCFAGQGPLQARQAGLVRRYAIDEVNHSDLARQLACSPSALRVRVHKAMRALRRYIETCHPDLGDLVERRGVAPRAHSELRRPRTSSAVVDRNPLLTSPCGL